jgi:hypothetical protein
MRRPARLRLLTVVIAGTCGALGLATLRPSRPAEWGNVRPGMAREEALARVPDRFTDLRYEKGFEVASREFRPWGFRSCWWQLFLRYDGAGRVASVSASFTEADCGWLNLDEAAIR